MLGGVGRLTARGAEEFRLNQFEGWPPFCKRLKREKESDEGETAHARMIPMDPELFSFPDGGQLLRVSVRLTVAAILGGLIGAEREYVGKAAGLRTHMTVALGAAAFVLVILENGGNSEALARAVQGVAAGIGFIGAGTILKRNAEEDIQGLTTAATIWLTAAVGLAAGAGLGWLAVVSVACAWVILTIMSSLARWLKKL